MSTHNLARATRRQYDWPEDVGQSTTLTTAAKITSFRVLASSRGRRYNRKYSVSHKGTKNGLTTVEVTRVA